MSNAGVFLIDKAKKRRRIFRRRHRWLLAVCTAVPLLTAAYFSLFLENPLVPWVTNREFTAFWIGAAIVGAAWVAFLLLGLDGAKNLRDAAEAEKWTAYELRPLRRQGWVVLHDIQLDGWNIDHALVGPRGAVAVETKQTNDELQITDRAIQRVRLNGKPRPDGRQLRDAKRHARDLRGLLEDAGVHTEVLPVLVFWGPGVARIDRGARWINGILVAVGAQSKDWLGSLKSQPLTEQQVDRAVRALRVREHKRFRGVEQLGSASRHGSKDATTGIRARGMGRDQASKTSTAVGSARRRGAGPVLPAPRGECAQMGQSCAITPTDRALFEALRQWRRQVAIEEGIPPYIVFHDRHLREIAQRKPTTTWELFECPGVGPVKLKRYGDGLLQVIERGA